MTLGELVDKPKDKPYVEWTDLVRLIEDEFEVSLVVEERPAEDDVEAIAHEPEVWRQIQMSQQDQENGRIYTQEAGLDYVQSKIHEAERG